MSDFGQGFRLSPQQRRLWALQQADSGRAWRASCAIEIEGGIDRVHLERAAQELAARWEILRTTLRRMPGVSVPVQVIRPELPAGFDGEELDVEAGPVLSATLAPLGPGRQRLVLELPSLFSDAEGLGLLSRELAAILLGASPGGECEPMQYADLAEWQNELLEEEEGTSFWTRQDLSGLLGLTLPGAVTGGAFAPRALPLPWLAGLQEPLTALAARLGISSDAALLAAWQALLLRSTGHSEIAVGLVCDGRRYAEVREALGLLSRHVPVRTVCAEADRFEDLAARAEQGLRDAIRRQEYFAPPDAGAFFAFSFETGEEPLPMVSGGVSFMFERPRAMIDRFTVQLGCVRRAAELRFDAGALTESEARRLAERFEVLLRDVLARPQVEIGALRILGDAERRQELHGWNCTTVSLPDSRPVYLRIAEQASLRPEAPALIFAGSSLSYANLDARSNQLARYLLSLGVRSETRVGVCLERSPEVVVAVLAVLKAGGAFVPLDPDYPAHRLVWTLEDSGAAVLITRGETLARLPACTVHAVRLDADSEAISACNAGSLPGEAMSENLAYVIYTSGSTGQPKGVGIPHAALANYLGWLEATYPLAPADRLLLKAAFSFDVAVREILWPLASGAALVIAEPGGQRDTGYLARLISEQGVTVVNFVPSLLAAFLEQPDLAACASLKRVLSGGEALSPQLRDRFFERLGSPSLHNHYGPTEATITSTCCTCERGDGRRAVSIGRPIANAQASVLDISLEPVPVGAPGELAIGGAGLARGYLGNPAATAAAFVPDPHVRTPGQRIYLTGDLARRLPDGSLEFLGRGDDQVKVRGFRIELGEIEFFLREHPAVSAATVVAREDDLRERRLVAYLVAAGPAGVEVSSVREWLLARVPEHMLPSAWVLLDALPLSPNGKVDRRALPAPEAARSAAAQSRVVPRNAVEEAVADVWAEVLKLDRVGVEDDFFALGGHSLLAMQVVSRLQETFRAPLPLRALFEESTVEKLSLALVAAEPRPGQVEKIAGALKQVRELSAEGVQSLLSDRRTQGGGAA